MIDITKEELKNIKSIIENSKNNLYITHDWIRCHFGKEKTYEELDFTGYDTFILSDISIDENEESLIVSCDKFNSEFSYKSTYQYATLVDKVIYYKTHFDIIQNSYSTEENNNALLVWRFYH